MTWYSKAFAAADRLVHRCWSGAFRIAGFLRPRLAPARPAGGQRILVIAPHPDDEALGCGGALMQHVAASDEVHVLIVTDGRLSRAGGLDADAMAATRRGEADAAAQLLGIHELHWLGHREGNWSETALVADLQDALRIIDPHIVYAPTSLDYHPEHRRVARCLAGVVPAAVEVRIYTLHIPLNRLANLYFDVSDEIPAIAALFDTYASQKGSLLRGLRLRRYAAALGRSSGALEAFCAMPGRQYRASHRDPWAPAGLRGLRYWSLSDPLAYLLGGSARRELAKRAAVCGPQPNGL